MVNNYTNVVNGRIWLMWDYSCYDISIVETNAQFLHYDIQSRIRNLNCLLIVVYRYSSTEQRKELWARLKTMQCNKPWLLVGDFNAMMSSHDRMFGVPVTSAKTKDFMECVQRYICI